MTKLFSVSVFVFVAVAVCSPQDHSRGNWLLTSRQTAVKWLDDQNAKETLDEAYQLGFCEGIIRGVVYPSPKVCLGENRNQGSHREKPSPMPSQQG